MATRREMWERLGTEVDLLVVGGGITGAGVARDAARRGLSVALVDMSDLASGTSSRSSKLVHGGLRYLEHYEFSLVFEAVSERRILMDLAPHLVNPLGFLFPVYAGSRHKLWFIQAGMWLYDGLSLFRSPKRHRKLKPKEVAELEPAVKQDGLKGAPLYYDCSTDDARLTLENALDAVQSGAVVVPWCRVDGFLKEESGRVHGAVVRDVLSGELKEVMARTVVNATGPWTDRTIALSKPLAGGNLLRPTKGVHIVVDFAKLPLENAVVCFHPQDERVLFAIPWRDRTYIGTTDTDFDGDPALVTATSEDVDYLIDASNHYFPHHQLARGDVIATWSGLRPLIAPPSAEGDLAESAVSREHQIVVGQDGLITIAGGKLTTYRRMAVEIVDTVARMLQLSPGFDKAVGPTSTHEAPLPGGQGWPEDDDHDAVASKIVEAGAPHVPPDVARNLGDTYGMRGLEVARLCVKEPDLSRRLVEGRPEILAQVDWAVTQELATRVADVLIRRMQLYYRDLDQGLGVAPAVADRMAALLDWDRDRRDAELEHYRAEVALSRQWRDELA